MCNELAWRGVWLAIIVLAAALVGLVAGLLSWAGGMNPANAVLAGGGAFAGGVLLLLSAVQFVAGAEARRQ